MPADNPLLVESTLPYHAPPFDKIKDEHFVPAIEAGMREQLKEVDAIAASAEKPTFDNTIAALERTGRLLVSACRWLRLFSVATAAAFRVTGDNDLTVSLRTEC
jgi:Zn-dependent oligopeptidase